MEMFYRSTRGKDELITSAEAIIRGIADDGGLYVPTIIPTITDNFEILKKMNYKETAFYVMKKFLPDFSDDELKICIENAYDDKFVAVAPMVNAAGAFFMELYHGKTLAFKDVALSILPHLMKCAYKKTGCEKEIVILTATSGDTGKAALEGFKDIDGIKIIVFYPKNGVSEIQKRQMITQEGSNTYVVGVNGNFDDAQSTVKKLFVDKKLREVMNSNNYIFSSANSINIGRLIPQVVYYVFAYLTLLNNDELKENEEFNVCVPTGNFGNILAAYYAKKMGVPIGKLICASNENNVLTDFFENGEYDIHREFKLTNSPSMDIVISSNLERLLYHISGEDSNFVKASMENLKKNGHYDASNIISLLQNVFYAGCCDVKKTIETIKDIYEKSDYLVDTHTAVAYDVYDQYRNKTLDNRKTVVVSTASPYKFVNSINDALKFAEDSLDEYALIEKLSEFANLEIPAGIKDLKSRPVRHNIICEIDEVEKCVKNILKVRE